MKAVVNLDFFFEEMFYFQVLSKSAIQYYAVHLSLMKNCAMRSTQQHPLNLFHLLSLQKILCLHIESLSTVFSKPAQLNGQAWTFCIANVIPCLKVHSTHRLNLWMFTPVTYTGQIIGGVWSCVELLYGFSGTFKAFKNRFIASMCLHTSLNKQWFVLLRSTQRKMSAQMLHSHWTTVFPCVTVVTG